MGRRAVKKASRQEERRELLDSLLVDCETGRIKDFYDYVGDSVQVLDQASGTDRVFYKWLKRKYHAAQSGNEEVRENRISVQEYINWGAEKLAAEMQDLGHWSNGESWALPETKESRVEIWKKTLTKWWDEDTVPFLSDRKLKCSRRDVILYVLTVLEFTVEESNEMLDELSLQKDRDEVRRLYTLDFKEGLFQWMMYWNEKHPEKKVPYHKVCELYLTYGGQLLWYVKERLDETCLDLRRWREERQIRRDCENAEVKRQLAQLEELEESCSEMRKTLTNDGSGLYDEIHAENLKRSFAVLVHAKRILERRKEEWNDHWYTGNIAPDQRLAEIRWRNENTRAERGTQYAWRQLIGLADMEQGEFTDAFKEFMNQSVDFLSEAHWRQFSELIYLYGRSGGFSREEDPFVKPIRFSEQTKSPRLYRDAGLFRSSSHTVLSFAYDGNEINKALDSGTANGTYVSSLLEPALRNSGDMFSKGSGDSSDVLSLLRNSYEAWYKGGKGPYAAYKRDKILKIALAAGVDDAEGLKRAMALAGNANFNYLDRKEAMVYLMARYREELKRLFRDMQDALESVEDAGVRTPNGAKAWNRAREIAAKLPAESLSEMPDCMRKDAPVTKLDRDVQMVTEWWDGISETNPVPALIAYIRKADFLTIRFGASKETAEKIRMKLFYGPYSGDFSSKEGGKTGTVAEEISWADIQCKAYDLLDDVLPPDAVKAVFELWYETTRWNDFMKISPESWYQKVKAGEKRVIENRLIENRLEVIIADLLDVLDGDWDQMADEKEEAVSAYLEQFHAAVAEASFMRQNPNALETKFMLEQWFHMLAVLQLLGFEVGDSVERLKEYVFHWIVIGGINNFKYEFYKKKTGLSSLEEKKNRPEYEDFRRIFPFWEEIYSDYKALCLSVEWFRENRPEQSPVYEAMLAELRKSLKEAAMKDEEAGKEEETEAKDKSRKSETWPFKNMKSDWESECEYAESALREKDNTDPAGYEKNVNDMKAMRNHFEWFYKSLESEE